MNEARGSSLKARSVDIDFQKTRAFLYMHRFPYERITSVTDFHKKAPEPRFFGVITNLPLINVIDFCKYEKTPTLVV